MKISAAAPFQFVFLNSIRHTFAGSALYMGREQQPVIYFDTVGVFRFMAELHDSEAARNFYERHIGRPPHLFSAPRQAD